MKLMKDLTSPHMTLLNYRSWSDSSSSTAVDQRIAPYYVDRERLGLKADEIFGPGQYEITVWILAL